MELVDRTVLITGGARGIGAALARALAGRGAKLSLVGLEPEALAAVASELGPEHIWFEADVTDPAALDAAVMGTMDKLGGIDVVVANAGLGPTGTLKGGDADAFVRAIDVNLTGVLRTVQATIRPVIDRQGYVLLVSSAAALSGVPGMGAYAASKAGVESLARSLRLEVAASGTAVGSAHPCWIETEMVGDPAREQEGFRRFLAALPWPLGTTTSVEKCATALARGIARRKRRIYVPRSIAIPFALRGLVNSRAGEAFLRRRLEAALPVLDEDVARHGSLAGRAGELERERETVGPG